MTVQCAASLHWLLVFQPQLLDHSMAPWACNPFETNGHVACTSPWVPYVWYWYNTYVNLTLVIGIEYKSKIKWTESLNQGFMKISITDFLHLCCWKIDPLICPFAVHKIGETWQTSLDPIVFPGFSWLNRRDDFFDMPELWRWNPNMFTLVSC